MDTQTICYIALAAAAVGIFTYNILSRNKRRNDRYMRSIISSWGNLPNREYDFGELEKIAKYYEETKDDKKYCVDDITWNDLDMDSLYCMINQCRSSSGDDYLYKMLRMPLTDKKELEKRKQLIDFFSKNEKTRINYQMELSKIGHAKKIALIEYVNTISKKIPDSNLENYMHLLLYVVCIASIILQPVTGILVTLAVLAYNIYTYYKKKTEIEPYFISVGIIVHLVSCAEGIIKLNVPELKEYTDNLKASVKKISAVKGNAKFLGSTDKFSGDISTVFIDYLNMIFRTDLIMFNKILSRIQKYNKDMLVLMEELGRLDAYISVASFREMMPFYCDSELEEERKCYLHTKDMYHPLLSNPVASSLSEDRPVLLTGSNASGKSTFLKTVAINAILSQTCAMALAREYKSNFYRVYSSMALKDNIQGNESYFIVEIKSLKRILDSTKESEIPVMCFVDEVLRGTNTVERIAASSQILKSFADNNVFCFAATHDIELTHMLEKYFSNYHFKEDVKENDVIFNYQLYKGRATSRNAIKLLGVLGYEKDIIEEAESTAEKFLETGLWELE